MERIWMVMMEDAVAMTYEGRGAVRVMPEGPRVRVCWLPLLLSMVMVVGEEPETGKVSVDLELPVPAPMMATEELMMVMGTPSTVVDMGSLLLLLEPL